MLYNTVMLVEINTMIVGFNVQGCQRLLEEEIGILHHIIKIIINIFNNIIPIARFPNIILLPTLVKS